MFEKTPDELKEHLKKLEYGLRCEECTPLETLDRLFRASWDSDKYELMTLIKRLSIEYENAELRLEYKKQADCETNVKIFR